MDESAKEEVAESLVKILKSSVIIRMSWEDHEEIGKTLEKMIESFFQGCLEKSESYAIEEEKKYFEKCIINFLFIATKIVCQTLPVEEIEKIQDSIFKELLESKKEKVE